MRSSRSSNQLQLWFKYHRPDSGSHRTISAATGKDLDQIAESFGLWRRGSTRPSFTHPEWSENETDAELRTRVKACLDGYYENV